MARRAGHSLCPPSPRSAGAVSERAVLTERMGAQVPTRVSSYNIPEGQSRTADTCRRCTRPQTAVKFCREPRGRASQLRVRGDRLSLTVAAAGLGARSQGCLLCTPQQVFPRAVSLLRLQTASLGRKSQKSQPGLTGSRRPCLGCPCTLDAVLVASGCPAASSGPAGRP